MFPVCRESRRVTAELLHAQHRLLPASGKESLAVFRVALDPLTTALLAGLLLFANTNAVLRIGTETNAAPSLRRDLPLRPFLSPRHADRIAHLFEILYGGGARFLCH